MVPVANATLLGPVYDIRPGETNGGNKMITFKIKTWRSQGENKEDKKMFFKVVAYGKAASVLAEHLRDGKMLFVDGVLDLYKDRDGAEHFQVIMEKFCFAGDI